MTIRKGHEWGAPTTRPDDLAVVRTDAALAAYDQERLPVGLAGGDLFRALGSPPPRRASQLLPIDRLHVVLDERTHLVAVAHVVARRSWWRGPLLAVCNVDHVGTWNVAPRAHPNDGRFDIVEVDHAMRPRERWAARRRLRTGTHVPHPAITVRTATQAEWTFDRANRVVVDGVEVGRVRRLAVRIEPDALAVVV